MNTYLLHGRPNCEIKRPLEWFLEIRGYDAEHWIPQCPVLHKQYRCPGMGHVLSDGFDVTLRRKPVDRPSQKNKLLGCPKNRQSRQITCETAYLLLNDSAIVAA